MGTGILKAGDEAIDFTLIEAGSGRPLTLSEFRGRQAVVLLFYRGLW